MGEKGEVRRRGVTCDNGIKIHTFNYVPLEIASVFALSLHFFLILISIAILPFFPFFVVSSSIVPSREVSSCEEFFFLFSFLTSSIHTEFKLFFRLLSSLSSISSNLMPLLYFLFERNNHVNNFMSFLSRKFVQFSFCTLRLII